MKTKIESIKILHNPVASPQWRATVTYQYQYGWFLNESWTRHVEGHSKDEVERKAAHLADPRRHINGFVP